MRLDRPTELPATVGASADGSQQIEDLARQLSGGYRSVGAMVYEILKEAIVAGTLAPGERLRQETLADAIGVSRVPVRSALIQLEADGLVQFHDRRGAVVKSLSAEQVREIYDLRILLETYAIRRSLDTMTGERVELLRELAVDVDVQDEGSAFVHARGEFYRVLYDEASNPQLLELINELRLKVGHYLLGWRMAVGPTHSHGTLVDAVASGDSARVEKLLQEHLVSVRDGVLGMIAADTRAKRLSHTKGIRSAGSRARASAG